MLLREQSVCKQDWPCQRMHNTPRAFFWGVPALSLSRPVVEAMCYAVLRIVFRLLLRPVFVQQQKAVVAAATLPGAMAASRAN